MPFPKGFDADQFLQELNKRPDLYGCRVVYYDGAVMATLRPGPALCREDLVAVVIRRGGQELLPTSAEVQQAMDERFHGELLNLAISCGGAVLSWVAVLISGAAAPVTGGLSLLITGAAYTATAAGYVQCGIAVARVIADRYSPQLTIELDNAEWYQTLSSALDIIGLAGAAAAAGATTKAVLLLKRSTGQSMTNIIRGLSRQERKRLTEEIMRSLHPGLSNSRLKLMQLAEQAPKRYSSKAISDGIRRQLMDAVGATGNIAGSATSGKINQLMSTSDENYIVGVVSAYETQ